MAYLYCNQHHVSWDDHRHATCRECDEGQALAAAPDLQAVMNEAVSAGESAYLDDCLHGSVLQDSIQKIKQNG